MASLTRWTWVWVNSGRWWWTGRPGVLRFMGSQRVGHDWATELNWTECYHKPCPSFPSPSYTKASLGFYHFSVSTEYMCRSFAQTVDCVCQSFPSKEQVSFTFMAAVTGHSDFGAQEKKISHCFHFFPLYLSWSHGTRASLIVQLVKNPPAMQETSVQFLSWEDPLEKGKGAHSSILGLPLWLSCYRICLQCRRPGFDPWVGKIPWRRIPTPVFWPREFHRLYSPWGHKESRCHNLSFFEVEF